MLVIANVGNTHLRLVAFEGPQRLWDRRVSSRLAPGEALPEVPAGAAIALVSVVPAVAEALIAHWGPDRVLVIRSGLVSDPRVAVRPPEGLGADRLCNAVAIRRLRGWGVAIDCGTATTMTVVDRAGVLVGGAIMPGLATAMRSLNTGTAQLPEVPVVAPEAPWGDSTASAIQTGIVHGHAGAIRHLVGRVREALPGAPVVMTGGWSELLSPLLPEDFEREPDLTIEGARLIWQETRGR
ncbi:MAG: type III pantothenate kinase [Candidatus Sericytochromatia bacterium]